MLAVARNSPWRQAAGLVLAGAALAAGCTGHEKSPSGEPTTEDKLTLPPPSILQAPGESLALSAHLTTAAAQQQNYSAFNPRGDGMSVWYANSGSGGGWFYSVFHATSQHWSDATRIGETPADITLAPRNPYAQAAPLASDGHDFVLAWAETNSSGRRELRFLRIDPDSSDAPPVAVPAVTYSANDAPVVTVVNGRFCLSWLDANQVNIYVLDTGGPRLDTYRWRDAYSATANTAGLLQYASDGDRLLLAWPVYYKNSGNTLSDQHVYLYRSDDPGRSLHSVVATGHPGSMTNTGAAAAAGRYGLTWLENDLTNRRSSYYGAVCAMDNAADDRCGPAQLLDESASISFPNNYPSLAMNAGAAFTLWRKKEDPDHTYFSTAATADPTTAQWSSPDIITFPAGTASTGPVAIHPLDPGFLLSQETGSTLNLAEYRDGSWQGIPPPPTLADGFTSYIDLYTAADAYTLFWLATDKAGQHSVFAARRAAGAWQNVSARPTATDLQLFVGAAGDRYWLFDTQPGDDGQGYQHTAVYQNDWQTEQTLPASGRRGGAWAPHLAHSGNDTSVALWQQFNNRQWQLNAAYRVGDRWSSPYRVSEPKAGSNIITVSMDRPYNDDPRQYQVATAVNGGRILAAWYDNRQIKLLDLSDQGPPRILVLADLLHEAWMMGTLYGVIPWRDTFAVCWQKEHTTLNQTTLYISYEEKGVWSHHELAALDAAVGFSALPLALSNGDLAVYWKEFDAQGERWLKRRTLRGSTWSAFETLGLMPPVAQAYTLAAGAGGDALLVYQTAYSAGTPAELQSRLLPQSGGWSDALTLPLVSDAYTLYRQADGYALYVVSGRRIDRSVYHDSDGQWSAAENMVDAGNGGDTTPLTTASFARNGDNLLFVWNASDSGITRLYSRRLTAAGLLPVSEAVALPATHTPLYPQVIARGEDFSLAWLSADSEDQSAASQLVIRLDGGP